MKMQELNLDELQNVNGGLLGLGNGDFGITGILEGVVGVSHTDENGNTESTDINFGLGGLLGGIFN